MPKPSHMVPAAVRKRKTIIDQLIGLYLLASYDVIRRRLQYYCVLFFTKSVYYLLLYSVQVEKICS